MSSSILPSAFTYSFFAKDLVAVVSEL